MGIVGNKIRFGYILAYLALPSAAQAIIAGTPMAPDEPIGLATLVLGSSDGRCAATVVGRRVLLTDAHCIQNSTDNRILVGSVPVRVACDRHPQLESDPSADFALCIAGEDLPVGTIAQINTDPARLTIGKRVLLVGRGCRDPGATSSIGELNQGEAIITTIPSVQNNFTLTKGAASCFGDAGGGMFEPPGSEQTRPLLLGTQARGDISQISFVTTLSTPTFLEWARSWSTRNSAAICGLSGDGAACEPVFSAADIEPRFTMSRPSSGDEAQASPRRLTTAVVYKPGETLQQIVERVCGPQEGAYYDALVKYHERTTGWTLTKDRVFTSAGAIDLPACLNTRRPKVKTLTAQEGDTPWRYFRREADGSQWKRFASAGAPSANSGSFLDAFRALNPSLNVRAPVKAGTVVLVPTAPLSLEKAAETTAGLQPKEPRAEIARTDAELQSANQECKGSDSADYPYDLAGLLDVLATNRPNSSGGTAIVLIGDSGIYVSNGGAFNKTLIERTPAESDWKAYLAKVTPLQSGSKPSHGTQVVSLVLGGPLLARMPGLENGKPRIKVKIARIYKETTLEVRDIETGKSVLGTKYLVDKNAFDEIVNVAFGDASIVNLSLKYYEDIPEIKSAIANKGLTLFVVAAGNDDGLLGDPPAGTKVFPAMYGGKIGAESSNLIAVAAVDGNREFPTISNFGPPWVEIGAPGCAIPVLSYNQDKKLWSVEKLHGTSLAAPLVSFTAALIKSEVSSWHSAAIKRRLMVSADLNPGLSDKIVDGRVLNIPKALSLWHDVLSLQNSLTPIRGTAQLKVGGQFKPDTPIEFKCSGFSKFILPKRILKAVPNFMNAGRKTVLKLYYESVDNSPDFENAECDTRSDLSVLIKDLELEEEREYGFDLIRDYVRRAF